MATFNVNLSAIAEQNLLAIAEYIAQDNPIRAFTFIEEIQAFAVRTLSIFPQSGKLYKRQFKDTSLEIRYIPYRDYIIIYGIELEQKHVEVLMVFNAAFDKDILLKGFD